MMNKFLILLVSIFLVSCETKLETVSGCQNCNKVEPNINGKPASKFFNQFMFKAKINTEGKYTFFYLQSELTPYPNSKDKFWSVDLKLMEEKSQYRLVITDWQKLSSSQVSVTASTKQTGVWKIKDTTLDITNWGKLNPHVENGNELVKFKFNKNPKLPLLSDKETVLLYLESETDI